MAIGSRQNKAEKPQHVFRQQLTLLAPRLGVEHPAQSPRKTGGGEKSGAESGALGARGDAQRGTVGGLESTTSPDLARVVEAWPGLPEVTRQAVLRLVDQVGWPQG